VAARRRCPADRRRPRAGCRPALALLAVLVAGCGGGSGDSTGPAFDLTGTFDGTRTSLVVVPARTALRLSLIETGGQVNGTYSTGTGDLGTIAGTVSGAVLAVRSRSTVLGIRCDYLGALADDGATVSGTFECSNGESGVFDLARGAALRPDSRHG
jgi:hypothetical protein